MSRHLLAIQKALFTDRAGVWENVIMAFHVFFPVFLQISLKRSAVFTSILFLIMGGRVHFKVRFTHKPPAAVLGHAFMGLDTSVNNHVLIKLALEAKFLPAGFTDEIFILLVFIYM